MDYRTVSHLAHSVRLAVVYKEHRERKLTLIICTDDLFKQIIRKITQ